MTDYISRKEAVAAIVAARDQRMKEQPYGWEWEYNGFNSAIQALPIPAADVRPVVHGRWEDRGSLSARCSECGCKSLRASDFCPNCGADMRPEP